MSWRSFINQGAGTARNRRLQDPRSAGDAGDRIIDSRLGLPAVHREQSPKPAAF